MLTQAYDFQTGHTIREHILRNDKIEAHHIFPKAWCCEEYKINSNSFRTSRFNCIVNKTPLWIRTNRTLGGSAPSYYLGNIEAWSNQLTLGFEGSPKPIPTNEKFNSHHIPIDEFKTDNFEDFFEIRKELLLKEIERAMEKKITREEENTLDTLT